MSNSTLTVTSSTLTVSVWFNALYLSNANPRLVANSHTDVDNKGFQLAFNSGGASGFFDVGNGTAEGRASWSQQLVEGTWYHYVGVYNGATVSAFLNGVQVASAAFAGGAIAAGTGPAINIARNPTYAGDYFIGAIWDVRIYEQALSAAQVLALYQAVTPPPPSGPAAEWTLTQASVSGATEADASGNGNSGTVINGPLTFGAMGANFNGQQYVDSTLTGTPSALTVAVWFNAANLSNANPRLVANSHTDVDNKGFQLMFNSGGGSGFFDVGNGTAEGRASWSQQLVEGTWYHYVGVYNGATVSAYLNGVQVASTTFAGGAIAAGTGPDINIARNPTYAGDYFIGAIYDVRIYNLALSAAQVLALYQAVTPPPTLSLALTPSAPTIPSSTPLGTTVATLQGVWSDGSSFTGRYTFVSPNYDADTYSISGNDLIVAPNGPGVGSAAGSVEQVTIEAVQIALTADSVTSSAPTGAPLATSGGVWSWGPAQAGRQIGGGGFQGDYVLYLNGMQVGSALLIEVANGGKLYANNSLFGWFVWNGTQFVSTSAP